MKTNRAYSTLEVKALDDEKRVITGIASTPSPDRMQDVVEPKGAQFKLPIPFLWQHNHDEPIGHVTEAKVTQKGIEVSVQLTQVEEPGKLKDRLDEAWQSIKSGLVRGLSIGFSAKEFEQIPGSWGLRFLSWEWFELSAVTIPANAEATITSVKSIDREQRAALGIKSVPVVRVTPAGASAIKTKTIKVPKPQEGREMKTIAEQIEAFAAELKTKQAAMDSLIDKSGEQGMTFDAEQKEEYKTLKMETDALEEHIDLLRERQKREAKSAKPISEDPGAQRMANVKTLDFKEIQVRAKNTQKLEPGIAFARAAKCLALGHLEHRDAIGIAKSLYDGQDSIIAATQRLVTKAAVAAATTSDATWAGPLVGDETSVFADFVEYLRPQTILGRFGTNGIPSLRRVPFRVPLIGQTSGGDGYWVGEGQAKPLTKFDFERKTLEPLKVANIAVATMEVIRDSSPSADVIIRDQLAAALRERLDIDFIDPAKAAVAGVSPASILNGVAGIPSSGNTADDVRADIRALFNAFIAANNAPTSGVWLMPATTALALSLMQNPLGQAEFPGISMTGGTLFGLPVIVSEYIPTASAGAVVALVNASDIYLGDEGGVDLSMSTEASLQMDNAPDNPTTASTVLVSLWQRNLVGFRAERAINWARRRASAVAYLTGVNWGAA
ncbi:TPA: phage major capsid protein [Pseudomonas aeruginosa]|nr:phage major capsid protein [Pseudomonas aeruginosa]HBO4036424.1 phage major capsid protein [Pseudomonas aeruginosa]HCR1670247.1 phage major capsid protein [Pseudomonas aeruginosa]